jgi:hypothetical protein
MYFGSRAARALLAVLVLFVAVPAVAATAAPVDVGPGDDPVVTTAAAPVIADDFADPWVVLDGGTYYAYSTNHGQRDCSEARVPFRTSTDLLTWRCPARHEALPTTPAWATFRTIWAPTVGRLPDGSWGLWFTSRRVSDGAWCVGAAFGSSPAGPFTPDPGPAVCQTDRGGTIDPAFFTDGDGTPYLVYKSEGLPGRQATQIWVRQLTADGRGFVGGETSILATSLPWEGNVIENPSMLRVDGRYYLFYSANEWYTTSYATGYAVCDTVRGPCHKPSDQPLITSQPGALGPGAPAPFFDAQGIVRLAHHAWIDPPCTTPECGRRALFITPLTVHGDTVRLGIGAVAISAARGGGYWVTDIRGRITPYGGAPTLADVRDVALAAPIVGMAAPPTGAYLLGSDGGVFALGGAPFHGSTGAIPLNRPVVAMAVDPDGTGYWFVASDGGIFAYQAAFHGSTGAMRLNQPVVGMAATPTGRGYWLVASDGGIFAFGDAPFLGSTGAIHLNRPIVAMAATPSGQGYWFVASDGGIFAFGDATFYGSAAGQALTAPVVGMAATRTGQGYWLLTADGTVLPFGDATA